MKLIEPIERDERARADYGRIAAIWLGITQMLMVGVLLYRAYVLGAPDDQVGDLRMLLMVSIFGHVISQLWFGGLLPVPTWRGMALAYVGLAAAITGVCLIIYGVPAADQWSNTWLPSLLGPALFVGGYRLVAWLGRWRIERIIGE